MAFGCSFFSLLESDADCIGGFAVHRQYDINFATPGQTARQAHIDLIQADKFFGLACELDTRAHAANCATHRAESAAEANSSAVKYQKYLIAYQA